MACEPLEPLDIRLISEPSGLECATGRIFGRSLVKTFGGADGVGVVGDMIFEKRRDALLLLELGLRTREVTVVVVMMGLVVTVVLCRLPTTTLVVEF